MSAVLFIIILFINLRENLNVSLSTVAVETDFIKYERTYGDNIQANVDANFIHSSVNLEGKESSKLQSSFGSLKKEEVDVQRLLEDSKDRLAPYMSCLRVLV